MNKSTQRKILNSETKTQYYKRIFIYQLEMIRHFVSQVLSIRRITCIYSNVWNVIKQLHEQF